MVEHLNGNCVSLNGAEGQRGAGGRGMSTLLMHGAISYAEIKLNILVGMRMSKASSMPKTALG